MGGTRPAIPYLCELSLDGCGQGRCVSTEEPLGWPCGGLGGLGVLNMRGLPRFLGSDLYCSPPFFSKYLLELFQIPVMNRIYLLLYSHVDITSIHKTSQLFSAA